MSWEILLFETNRTDRPVEEFIKKQQPQARAKIIHHINLLAQYGSQLGMPHSKRLSKGIYELRIRGKEEIRIFYCFKGKIIYLLHAFKKQTKRTPTKELNTAKERLRNLT